MSSSIADWLGSARIAMSSTREAIKCSLLQLKTTRRTGTLRKKTKLVYGDPCWVVLCVHDNKIPCLEWYRTEESIRDHEPFKVIDLLFASYVNHVFDDPRTFIIGLSEVEPLELVALQPVTTTEWIEVTTETLKRLSILNNSTNIYEPGTSKTEFKDQKFYQGVQESLMDIPTPIVQHRTESRLSNPTKSACAHVSFQGGKGREQRPCSFRPPLPPRRPQEPLRPRRSGSFSDLTTNGCLSPGDEHSVTPHILSPLYDTPRSEFVTGVATPPRSPRTRRNGEKRSSHQMSQSIYDTLSPSHQGSSPLQSTISTNSLCSSLSSELRLSTVLPTTENSEYDYIREGFHTKVKYVSLNLSIIVEHVLFVEIKNRIWVAGWSDIQDKQLSTMLNFGDELVEVEGHIIRGMTDIPQIFYNVSAPGTPISFVFRPTPFGISINLMRTIKKDKDIGIRLHKHKNRIAEIVADSSAARRGLTAVLPSAFHGEHQSSTVITEVAGRRLNPFSRNDQFFLRYEEIRDGTEFSITVHPHDFMKEMKLQLSSTKNYKAYLPPL